MSVFNVIQLFGGLAMFLYGMSLMSDKLEKLAGGKLEQIFEKLTSNRFKGLLLGVLVTAVVQSSSATTVMLVGFVNSGIMRLSQAISIIMGANIGTTVTTWLLSLSGLEGDTIAIQLCKPENFAPVLALIGVVMRMTTKNGRKKDIGGILVGFALLMIGMDTMGNSMAPLKDSESFESLLTLFKNPLLGVMVGALLTAIIQSSAASVGMLQSLSQSGKITFGTAFPIILGQNIGTCITAVLASIGTSRNAKRTTIIHLSFNIIGTIVFTIICMVTPFVSLMEGLTPNVSAQIANTHTIFNITTTLLLLPFGTQLAKMATKILPDRAEEKEDTMHLEYIQPMIPIETRGETKIGISAIAVNAIRNELTRMTKMAKENVALSFDAVREGNTGLLEEVRNREEYIDFLNKEISKYISRMLVKERNPKDSQYMSVLFKVCGNLERIGDHAMNICEYTNMIQEKQISFSAEVIKQIGQMKEVCNQALDMVLGVEQNGGDIKEIEQIEQKIDDMTEDFRKRQIDRMQTGACSDEGCVLYSEMLTDFERIGDHILNIGQEISLGAVGD